MDLGTQTPSSETPPQPPAPYLNYFRAIASESRRFYHGLTRENITAFLKTMAWAAPLTVLIWVYAESEQQVTDANQPISIEVRSRDPNKIVTLERGVRSIICDLSGPRSNLDRFKETLSTSAPIVIELDTRQMSDRDEFIPTLDNLRDNPRFRDAGVTVDKCDPASLPVYVDTLDKRTLPIKAPAALTSLSEMSFEPPSVSVSGPRRFLRSLSDVTADLSGQPELSQPGAHTIEVSIQEDPSGALTYSPTQVKAKFTVAQTDVTASIGVPVFLEIQSQTAKNYDITPSGSQYLLVNMRGPQDQITRLKNKEIIPHALLEIDDSNVNSTTPVPLNIVDLPPGVHLADSTPEITFTATHR